MFEGIQGILISIYMIGALITLGGVMLFNAAEVSEDYHGISFAKSMWLTAIWPITLVVVAWEIYKINRDGA